MKHSMPIWQSQRAVIFPLPRHMFSCGKRSSDHCYCGRDSTESCSAVCHMCQHVAPVLNPSRWTEICWVAPLAADSCSSCSQTTGSQLTFMSSLLRLCNMLVVASTRFLALDKCLPGSLSCRCTIHASLSPCLIEGHNSIHPLDVCPVEAGMSLSSSTPFS